MKRIIWLLMLMCMMAIGAAAQTTPFLGFNIPSHGTLNWDTQLNSNFSSLDNLLSGHANIPAMGITGNLNVGGTITCGSGCQSVTFATDLSGNNTSQTVVGLLGNALPSLSAGCLNWTGAVFQFVSCGALTGTGTATQVAVWGGSTTLTSYAGFTTDSSGNVSALTLATTGSNAGMVNLGAGPDNSGNCGTSFICDMAPTSVTKYTITRSGTGPSVAGIPLYSALSSSKTTQTWGTLSNAAGTKLATSTGTLTNGDLACLNSSGDYIDCGVAWPQQVGTPVNQTGLTNTLNNTALFTNAPQGQYVVSMYINEIPTLCSNVTAGSVVPKVTYTDTQGAITKTLATLSFTTAGNSNTNATVSFWNNSTTTINAAATYVACTTGTGTYDVHFALYRVQ